MSEFEDTLVVSHVLIPIRKMEYPPEPPAVYVYESCWLVTSPHRVDDVPDLGLGVHVPPPHEGGTDNKSWVA